MRERLVRSSLRVLAIAAVLLAAALVLLKLWLGGPVHTDLADPDATVALPGVNTRFAGTASCAGRSCHGGIEPVQRADGPLRNEYTTWATRDPHAGAYATLLTMRSQNIARHLGIAKAHESARCLACHTTPDAAIDSADAGTALVRAERRAGVGCEACHGNAVHWLDAHTAKRWAGVDAAQRMNSGMIAVADPAALAQRCAGCHVGAPPDGDIPIERDVNHDLIAAGHPRLAFEFASFLANLPPHWRSKGERPMQRWAVGQAVSADAALRLLQHRAASPRAPWPEFAEYDCFGCHHDLADPGWRQQTGRRRGTLAWGTWYLSLPRALATGPLPAVTALTAMLEKPCPPRAAVAKQSPIAIKEMQQLAAQFAARHETPASARAQMDALLANRALQRASSWDAAEQTYLALWSLNRTAQNAHYARALDSLLDARAYRAGWDGPVSLPKVGFVPAAFIMEIRQRLVP